MKKETNIPIFHDDQHGTAIVTVAGLVNALKLVGKKMSDIKVVANGAGAQVLQLLNFYIAMVYATLLCVTVKAQSMMVVLQV